MYTSWSLMAVLVLANTGCYADECHRFEPFRQYYTELGCVPVQATGAPCPTEYDCTDALDSRDLDTCYLNGNAYESGTIIKDLDGSTCVGQSCQCESGIIDCPWLEECPQYSEELPDGCQDDYEPGECCPTGTLCFPVEIPEGSPGTCQYGSRTFAVGQYIDQYDKPCKACYCQEGFDGTLDGPWCMQRNCFYELYDSDQIAHGCVPIVYQTPTCCSDEWRCPSSDDVIDNSKYKPSASNSTCTFGDLTLRWGDFLYRDNPCVVCTCAMPPHITCFKKDGCAPYPPPNQDTAFRRRALRRLTTQFLREQAST